MEEDRRHRSRRSVNIIKRGNQAISTPRAHCTVIAQTRPPRTFSAFYRSTCAHIFKLYAKGGSTGGLGVKCFYVLDPRDRLPLCIYLPCFRESTNLSCCSTNFFVDATKTFNQFAQSSKKFLCPCPNMDLLLDQTFIAHTRRRKTVRLEDGNLYEGKEKKKTLLSPCEN